jgi:hypothetical protein
MDRDRPTIDANGWTLLVYRIPPQPTRLRLSVWRRLQAMGALYLQDGVCLLPVRPDLSENLAYVAAAVTEMGGVSHLFSATVTLPGGNEPIVAAFRAAADARLAEILANLTTLGVALDAAATPGDWERAEEGLKRERIAYLRARRLAYFGGTREREAAVDASLEHLRRRLDDLYRGGGGKSA